MTSSILRLPRAAGQLLGGHCRPSRYHGVLGGSCFRAHVATSRPCGGAAVKEEEASARRWPHQQSPQQQQLGQNGQQVSQEHDRGHEPKHRFVARPGRDADFEPAARRIDALTSSVSAAHRLSGDERVDVELLDCTKYDSFESCGITDARLLRNLEEQGITRPTEVQRLVLPPAIEAGRHVVLTAATGSGKTLAYVLPIVQRLLNAVSPRLPAATGAAAPAAGAPAAGAAAAAGATEKRSPRHGHTVLPRALVLVPTRELAIQVANVISRTAAGLGMSATAAASKLPPELRPGTEFLVATPAFLNTLDTARLLSNLEYVVVDELDAQLFGSQGKEVWGLLVEIKRLRGIAAVQHFLAGATLTDRGGMYAQLTKLRRRFAQSIFVTATGANQTVDTLVEHFVRLPSLDYHVASESVSPAAVPRRVELGSATTTELLVPADAQVDASEGGEDGDSDGVEPWWEVRMKLEQKRAAALHAFEQQLKLQEVVRIVLRTHGVGGADGCAGDGAEFAFSYPSHTVRLRGEAAPGNDGDRQGDVAVVGPFHMLPSDEERVRYAREPASVLAPVTAAGPGETPRTLVFAKATKDVCALTEALQAAGVTSAALFAKQRTDEREAALAHFTAGHTQVLVSTDLVARGLDFAGSPVSQVISMDFPGNSTTYLHRVGRTARAGRPGTAISLLGESDLVLAEAIQHASSRRDDQGDRLHSAFSYTFSRNRSFGTKLAKARKLEERSEKKRQRREARALRRR